MAQNYQRRILIDAQLMPIVERLRTMGSILHYQFMSEQPWQNGGAMLRFEHSAGLASWGEIITITLSPYGPVQCVANVYSESMLPSQIIDWGRNSKNVNEIIQFITNGLRYRDTGSS